MRNCHASDITASVIDGFAAFRQASFMLGTRELLDELAARGISRADIARAIKVAPARVTEMYAGTRAIKLDEGKRLVERFGLDDAPEAPKPLSEPISRLLVMHVARALAVPVHSDDVRLEGLALDLQAFSRFAADHQDELSPDAVHGFLRGRQSERPAPRRAIRK